MKNHQYYEKDCATTTLAMNCDLQTTPHTSEQTDTASDLEDHKVRSYAMNE